jgi:hypothetical protein
VVTAGIRLAHSSWQSVIRSRPQWTGPGAAWRHDSSHAGIGASARSNAALRNQMQLVGRSGAPRAPNQHCGIVVADASL